MIVFFFFSEEGLVFMNFRLRFICQKTPYCVPVFVPSKRGLKYAMEVNLASIYKFLFWEKSLIFYSQFLLLGWGTRKISVGGGGEKLEKLKSWVLKKLKKEVEKVLFNMGAFLKKGGEVSRRVLEGIWNVQENYILL